MITIVELTKNDSNRHSGASSIECSCGLVHDDELRTPAQIRDQVIEALGGKCTDPNCRWLNEDGTLGCKDKRYLQIDHTFDDGFQDTKRKGPTMRYLLHVLREVSTGRYQLLCANCNWAKRLATLFSRTSSLSGHGFF